MNLNIKVADLDRAGSEANAFNEASNAGGDVTIKLGQVIETLRTNWIGSDATTHLNNLIDLHTALYDIAHASIQISYDTVQIIRNMQVVRQSNGGGAVTVTSPTITSMPQDSREIERVADTTSYDVKDGASDDYEKLVNVKSLFLSFVEQYNDKYNTLLSNWTEGGNIDTLKQVHSNLNENADNFGQVLDNAIKNLNTALENISGLNSPSAE